MKYSPDFMGLWQSKTVLLQAVFFQKCLPVKQLSSLLIVILITPSLIKSPCEAITIHHRPSPQFVTGSQEMVTSDVRTEGCNFSLRFSSTKAKPHCATGVDIQDPSTGRHKIGQPVSGFIQETCLFPHASRPSSQCKTVAQNRCSVLLHNTWKQPKGKTQGNHEKQEIFHWPSMPDSGSNVREHKQNAKACLGWTSPVSRRPCCEELPGQEAEVSLGR